MTTVAIADVEEAARRIAPYVHRTPIARSATIDAEIGAEVFFKCENLQKVGAFKARGATNAILSLPEGTRAVATHSSGNHAQAVAYAAARRGLPAWIVMPERASPVKRSAVEGYGATVVLCREGEREAVAAAVAEEHGATIVHPFDDARVIAGQGTAALELFADVPDLDAVVAPIGGGGLLSGTAVVARDRAPQCAVLGAEPSAVDDAYRSLATGERQPAVPNPSTVADGLLTGIGRLPFQILRDLRAEILCVEEAEIIHAATTILMRMKLLVEPSGATPLAALQRDPDRFRGKRVGVIVSGGNTDLSWLPR